MVELGTLVRNLFFTDRIIFHSSDLRSTTFWFSKSSLGDCFFGKSGGQHRLQLTHEETPADCYRKDLVQIGYRGSFILVALSCTGSILFYSILFYSILFYSILFMVCSR